MIEQENFHILLSKEYEQSTSQDPFYKNRVKAWERYQAIGLPTRKTEVFRSLSLNAIFSQSYLFPKKAVLAKEQITPYIFPECQQSVLVFVNGQYCLDLSNRSSIPPQVNIIPLADATKAYGTFLNNHWVKSIKEEIDPFAAINASLHQEGVFLYIPPKSEITTPIQILHIIDTDAHPQLLMPRLQLFVGAHSRASFFFTSHCLSSSFYGINQVTDIVLEENARLHVTQFSLKEKQQGWHFDALRASLKKNSSFSCMNSNEGSQMTRHDYRVSLVGENAEATLEGRTMLGEKRETHIHVLMEHLAPYCRSNQLFKNALAGLSRCSFEGKIYVHESAKKTEAFQRIRTLMLSEHARVEGKPNLKIFNHDVKASHGATVGTLDKEQLHYLLTRGISEEIAKNLLISGFLLEGVEELPLPTLRQKVLEQIKGYLH